MVRFEEGNQKEELFAMWHRIFHDTIPYTQFYFEEVYGKNEVLLEEQDHMLRGMLHLNPYELMMGGDQVKAHYIVGVSTEEEYRRQGVMRNLLEETFRILRERKEPFTYLMPADEAYYLPFSFRFGMLQYEQELETGEMVHEERKYEILRSSVADRVSFAETENEWKTGRYDLFTRIDATYLARLEKEVQSEFGCFFYVKKDDKPIGRFLVYAENDALSISQMVCYDEKIREEFLQQILQFCDNRYHYRQYRITYAQDWEKDLLVSGQFGKLHVFQTRSKPVIMFRILNLDLLAKWIKVDKTVDCLLKVEDLQIKDQDGYYRFFGDADGLKIERLADVEDTDGTVDIATFTARIFGNLAMEEPPKCFKKAAFDFWKSIKAVDPIEISEIV